MYQFHICTGTLTERSAWSHPWDTDTEVRSVLEGDGTHPRAETHVYFIISDYKQLIRVYTARGRLRGRAEWRTNHLPAAAKVPLSTLAKFRRPPLLSEYGLEAFGIAAGSIDLAATRLAIVFQPAQQGESAKLNYP